MDAKRWSPLWVFVGGCLTGAAFIGLRSAGGGEELPNGTRAPDHESELTLQRAVADAPTGDFAARSPGEPPPATEPARDATKPIAAPPADAAEPGAAEAGNSVADVLSQLEAEYRQRNAPKRADELSSPPSPAPSVVSEAPAPKLAPSEQPVVRAALPPPEVSPPDAPLAKLPVEPKPVPSAVEPEPARVASVGHVQDDATDSVSQQLAAQSQQLAALQQAALIQQQYSLLQYRYLGFLPMAPGSFPSTASASFLSMAPASQVAVPAPAASQTPNARIVPGFPPSISATDNPWGFHYPPTHLVR